MDLDGHSLITPALIAAALHTPDHAPQASSVETATAEMAAHLDKALKDFEDGKPATAIVDRVTRVLHETRAALEPAIWHELVPFVQNHAVAAYFLQDPLTKWSVDKPRGYSGDAHLLDLIYRHDTVMAQVEAATPLGKELYEYTSTSPSSLANWDRRDILAKFVDDASDLYGPQTEVLSIAAGHLREAAYSRAFLDKRLGRYAALDQDPVSVRTIKEAYGDSGVDTIDGSVRDLLVGRLNPGKFDAVYASGLYDYLVDKVAIKLTQRALKMLKPGGVFLFANYSYPIFVDGYLETFMNWALLLRSEDDMRHIIAASTEGMDVETDVFFGKNRNIAYGTIRLK